SPFPILVSGAVVKGFGRGGKQLGIPTANLAEDAVERTLQDIPIGVYLGWAQIAGEQPVWPMVMSLGWNPFFKNERRSGEVHVIHNFDSDFYGRTLNVAILAYIRPERNYDSLDALIADIHFDIDVAHQSLAREAYQQVALEFDHQRYAALSSPGNREMFLFKWLSALDAHLEAAPESAQAAIKIGDRQQQLELLLLEIAAIPPPQSASSASKRRSWLGTGGPTNAAEPTGLLGAAVPSPSRVVRDLVARCLARLYELGHMHRIGDALHLLQTVLTRKTSSATTGTTRPVRSALVCVGALFESLAATAGFRLLSSFADFAAAAVRLARTADVSVRVDATRALARMLRSHAAATLLQERSSGVARDLVKCLRANVRHKSPALVFASAEALVALPIRLIGRPPDVERLVAVLVPLLATRVLVVRRALASLVGVLVARSISADLGPAETVAASEPPTSAKAASVDGPPMRASTGSRDQTATPQSQLQSPSQPSQSQPQSPSQPLQWLSAPFTRAGASRELRAGIVDAYAALFDALGEATLAQHYATISNHIIGELASAETSTNKSASCEAEKLGVRNMCAWLLRVPLAGRFPLKAKREAAQVLWDRWLATSETVGKISLLLAIHEWRRLPIHSDAVDSDALLPRLERLLAHPSSAVRIAAAAALRHVLEEHSQHAAPVLSSLMTRFQRLSADYAVDASAIDRAHL
ncbi:riboflavin kinase, partial [Coemansia sp. RSA 2703]